MNQAEREMRPTREVERTQKKGRKSRGGKGGIYSRWKAVGVNTTSEIIK